MIIGVLIGSTTGGAAGGLLASQEKYGGGPCQSLVQQNA